MKVQDWKWDAACYTEDGAMLSIFFGPDLSDPDVNRESRAERDAREARAREICESCRVQTDCFAYAVRFRLEYGIWAGLDGEVIQRARRRRRLEKIRV